MKIWGAIYLSFFLGFHARGTPQPEYVVKQVALGKSWWNPFAIDVNASGQVIGFIWGEKPWWDHGETFDWGFLVPREGKAELLEGYEWAVQLHDMNDRGQVVGERLPSRKSPDLQAFVYDHGKYQGLGTLGGRESSARAVNNRGVIVGTSQFSRSKKQWHAFVYREGKMTDLGTLGNEFATSEAIAVNDAGLILGWSEIAEINPEANTSYYTYTQRAFLYANGEMKDLGTLGGASSWPSAMNKHGDVVGLAQVPPPSPDAEADWHAFLYSKGEMKEISDGDGEPLDINSSGQVLFESGRVYKDGVFTEPENLISPSSGWWVWRRYKIRDDGSILVNAGADKSDTGTTDDQLWGICLLVPRVKTMPKPVVKIFGGKVAETNSETITLNGRTSGKVMSVTYKVSGRKSWLWMRNQQPWSATVKLRPSVRRAKVTFVAHGLGGDSEPATVTVIRR